MTKKDYELIAKVLNNWATLVEHTSIVFDFVDALKAENTKFNTEKFLEACGISQ